MRIINLNPADDIGASAWFVELEGHRLLLDAGVHPKREGRCSLPLFERIRDQEVDAIAITHCHHDHVGALPVAVRHFPRSHVLMTDLSYFLVERVLHNSVNVMLRQRDELGIAEYPLYTHTEVDEIASLFQGCRYNREIEWEAHPKARPGQPSPTLEFHDAGHALGSAGIMVRGARETLFYSGDISFRDQTILKGARFEGIEADVMILETTRGNRAVPAGFSREAEVARLATAIHAVQQRKGSVLIPTFALGRTQEILAMLALLMGEGKLRRQPVYIGGLGRVFTEIYDLEAGRTHRQHSSLLLHEALELSVLERGKAEKMRLTGSRLFVITAGMMSENTAAHDLAVRMAGEEKHGIFFVGYADPDTPGGRLKASRAGVPFVFSPSAGELTRRCQIEDFDLTAHANREELVDFVSRVQPRTLCLGHGEKASRDWIEQAVRARHPRMRIVQPGPGELCDAGVTS